VGCLIKSCHISKFFGYDAIKLSSHFSCNFLFMKTLNWEQATRTMLKNYKHLNGLCNNLFNFMPFKIGCH
jgi:hypothetical protein